MMHVASSAPPAGPLYMNQYVNADQYPVVKSALIGRTNGKTPMTVAMRIVDVI